LKNPSQKRAGGVSQGVGPEFKPQHPIKENKTRNKQKRAGGLVQLIKHLSSMCVALGSMLGTVQKTQNQTTTQQKFLCALFCPKTVVGIL
jgi:hypothetical protein